jgi:hypothetical protein
MWWDSPLRGRAGNNIKQEGVDISLYIIRSFGRTLVYLDLVLLMVIL